MHSLHPENALLTKIKCTKSKNTKKNANCHLRVSDDYMCIPVWLCLFIEVFRFGIANLSQTLFFHI